MTITTVRPLATVLAFSALALGATELTAPAQAAKRCGVVTAGGDRWSVRASVVSCKTSTKVARQFLQGCRADDCSRKVSGWSCRKSLDLTGGCRRGKSVIDLLKS